MKEKQTKVRRQKSTKVERNKGQNQGKIKRTNQPNQYRNIHIETRQNIKNK